MTQTNSETGKIENNNTRRKFIQQSILLGGGIMLAISTDLFAQNNNFKKEKNKMAHANSDTPKKIIFYSNDIKIAANLYYYKEEYVSQAVPKLDEFFRKNLG